MTPTQSFMPGHIGKSRLIDKTPVHVQQFLEKVVDLFWDLDSRVCLSPSLVSWLVFTCSVTLNSSIVFPVSSCLFPS